MYLLFVVLLLVGAYNIDWMAPAAPVTLSDRREEAAATYARGMIVYHQAAQKYRHAHPSFTGVIPASQMDLPDGYAMTAFFEAQATGEWVVVRALSIPNDIPLATLARNIQTIKDGAAGSGVIIAGELISARFAPITLPIAIPDGSAVIATRGG